MAPAIPESLQKIYGNPAKAVEVVTKNVIIAAIGKGLLQEYNDTNGGLKDEPSKIIKPV